MHLRDRNSNPNIAKALPDREPIGTASGSARTGVIPSPANARGLGVAEVTGIGLVRVESGPGKDEDQAEDCYPVVTGNRYPFNGSIPASPNDAVLLWPGPAPVGPNYFLIIHLVPARGEVQMLKSARKQVKYVLSSFAAVVFAVNC
jgi:hypothetical protein